MEALHPLKGVVHVEWRDMRTLLVCILRDLVLNVEVGLSYLHLAIVRAKTCLVLSRLSLVFLSLYSVRPVYILKLSYDLVDCLCLVVVLHLS